MLFNLKKPCAGCPFRTDSLPGWLGRARAVEIAGSQFGRFTGAFPCHKTLDYGAIENANMAAEARDEEPERDPNAGYTPGTQYCAGALILMKNEGTQNQMAQLAERFGFYDESKMDESAPVFKTVEDFVNHHSEANR